MLAVVFKHRAQVGLLLRHSHGSSRKGAITSEDYTREKGKKKEKKKKEKHTDAEL